MMRALLIPLLALLLAACTVPTPTSEPLVYDAAAMARARGAVVGIPGALTRIRVMAPLARLETADRAVAFYRLPGFDGRPADEYVKLDFAAARIARLVAEAGLEEITIVGHSTGAAIGLEAAKLIRRDFPDTRVRVIGISTALPAPQPFLAGVRGAAGTLKAAVRTGSLNPRRVWMEYYRELAYGTEARDSPQATQAADALVAANNDRIEIPVEGLARRHWQALRGWTNPDVEALAGVDVILFHGAEDPVFPPRVVARFARTLPQAELRVVPGHGHLLMLTYPEIWQNVWAAARAPMP